jgi:hypothetical protein
MNNHYLLQASPFPVASYDIASAWQAIYAKFPKPEYIIPVAVFNAAHGVWKPFRVLMSRLKKFRIVSKSTWPQT